MPAKRLCSSSEDGASPAKIAAAGDGRPKTSAKVLTLPKEPEQSTSGAGQQQQPSTSSASHVSRSSSSSTSSSSSEEDENDEDVEPSTSAAAAAHPSGLLAIVKQKPTMSDMVVKNVESLFRLIDK